MLRNPPSNPHPSSPASLSKTMLQTIYRWKTFNSKTLWEDQCHGSLTREFCCTPVEGITIEGATDVEHVWVTKDDAAEQSVEEPEKRVVKMNNTLPPSCQDGVLKSFDPREFPVGKFTGSCVALQLCEYKIFNNFFFFLSWFFH